VVSPLRSNLQRPLRIVLVHDWLCGYRGGEGVLERMVKIVRTYHDLAGLLVMFDDGKPVAPAIDATPRYVSNVGRWPFANPMRRYLLGYYPKAMRSLSRKLDAMHRQKRIDLVISSSSCAAKGIRPPQGVPHLCYCHAPARYIYGQQAEYTRDFSLRSIGLRYAAESFRRWDQISSSSDSVTRMLANSSHTAEQVTRAYERTAQVVFPPVRTDFFSPSIERMGLARGEHWLYVGALEPYKRVDLAILAANKLHHRLLIVGTGTMEKRLRALAGDTVEFLGRVSEEALREHYRSARLLLYPQIEDFGISAVEAQACGLPVVARRAGGAMDTVADGVTGSLFDSDSIDAIVPAIIRCPQRCDAACRVHAEKFHESHFDAALLQHIDSLCVAPLESTGERGA
jgi:glycosyltransferase involved in cell wall biosynthesis